MTEMQDIGAARVTLLESLSEARRTYGSGEDADRALDAWAATLAALWRFVGELDPPGDERATITALLGALADVQRGVQHPALVPRRTDADGNRKPGRPPQPISRDAALAVGSAVMDVLMRGKDKMTENEAARAVGARLGMEPNAMKRWRKNRHDKGKECGETYRKSRASIEALPEAIRRQYALGMLDDLNRA